MILAEKIAKLRKQNSWSQEELAGQLGISRQSVSKWESGASIPDLDKIIKMSGIFGVSTDYLLKDELEEVVYSGTVETCEEENEHSVSLEEANTFMELTERLAGGIAGAVLILILSPVCLILLAGLSSEVKNPPVTEAMAGGIGMVILLLMVAAGVAILIVKGTQLSKYEYFEREAVSLQYGVEGIVRKKRDAYEPFYLKRLAAGVTLCILGVVPLMAAAAFDAEDMVYICCVDVLLLMVAIGVYVMVRISMIKESYDKILQEGDYTKEKKSLNKKTSFFPGVYWCTVTAVFLAMGFFTENWKLCGLIWPVAGVLFAAILGIVNAVVKSRTEKQRAQ